MVYILAKDLCSFANENLLILVEDRKTMLKLNLNIIVNILAAYSPQVKLNGLHIGLRSMFDWKWKYSYFTWKINNPEITSKKNNC